MYWKKQHSEALTGTNNFTDFIKDQELYYQSKSQTESKPVVVQYCALCHSINRLADLYTPDNYTT